MNLQFMTIHWYATWRMRVRNAQENVCPDEAAYYCRAAAVANAQYVMALAVEKWRK